MNASRLTRLAMAPGAALVSPVYAQNLQSLYDSARSYDAAYQAAKFQYEVYLAQADEAKFNLLPTVNMGISSSNGQVNIIDSNPAQNNRNFTNAGATITASQPLYRPANLALYEQGKKNADLAQAWRIGKVMKF